MNISGRRCIFFSQIMNEHPPPVLPRSRTKSMNHVVCTWLNYRTIVPADSDKERLRWTNACLKSSVYMVWGMR